MSVQGFAFEPRILAVPREDIDTESDTMDELDLDINYVNRTGSVDWCRCHSCHPMPTHLESVCCHEDKDLQHRLIPGLEGEKSPCVVHNTQFQMVCLERDVLEVALLTMREIRGETLIRPISSRTYRLAAYRQFTLWARGRLGKGVRRVIPSCVVSVVRQSFPSSNYKGFEFNEED